MKNRAKTTNPFLVIRATVEAEISAPGILAVSSARARDGKTAVAAGIVASLAAAGYRALVIDGGSSAENETSSTAGPLSAEAAGERVSRAVRPTGAGCDYLALDDLGCDVSSSVTISALYEAVRARYDYTVVDGGDLSGNGVALARGADGVVLTVREGRAIAPADGEAVELLDRLRVRFLGVIATTERLAGQDSARATLIERLHRPVANPPAIVNGSPGQTLSPVQRAATLFGQTRQSVPVRSTTPE